METVLKGDRLVTFRWARQDTPEGGVMAIAEIGQYFQHRLPVTPAGQVPPPIPEGAIPVIGGRVGPWTLGSMALPLHDESERPAGVAPDTRPIRKGCTLLDGEEQYLDLLDSLNPMFRYQYENLVRNLK